MIVLSLILADVTTADRSRMQGIIEEDGIFRAVLEVPDEAMDTNGHVNNVVYIQWMQDIAVRHSLVSGGTAAMEREGGTWVARSHTIEYLRPSFAGDTLEISTWVSNIRRIRSLRKYEFTRISDGEIIARGETDWVFLDAATGKPAPIPESVSRCFRVINRHVTGQERPAGR